MTMTTECGGGGGDSANAEAGLAMAPLDAEVEAKRETSPPSPSISLKSVQERLSRFGSTVKFRSEAAEAAQAEDESCNQPQDLSVKRRDQGSQTTDCDRGGEVTIRRMSQKPSLECEAPAAAAPAPASDLERMLRILFRSSGLLVLFRRLAAAGAVERKSASGLPKVDCCFP